VRRLPVPRRLPTLARVVAFQLLGAGVGAVAGLVWWWVVDLPGYTVGSDGRAAAGEREIVRFIAADAWFSVLGLVVGLVLGVVGWRQFRALGWPVAPLAALAATVAALTCWAVGYQLGPGPFAARLADARAGAVVPIELTLRARTSLLLWPFAATVPVLFAAALGPEREAPDQPTEAGQADLTPRR
jgi:hypothetical protein